MDYCYLRGFQYSRLDGSMSYADRDENVSLNYKNKKHQKSESTEENKLKKKGKTTHKSID